MQAPREPMDGWMDGSTDELPEKQKFTASALSADVVL